MLIKDPFIIAPKTFALIQNLQKYEELNEFILVGGTALALQIGHRNSIDIDLFTRSSFDTNELAEFLEKNFPKTYVLNTSKNSLSCVIDNVKADFIRHDYPYLADIKTEEDIFYLGLEDISAFKLNAIVNSGQRLKDFVDIYFLLTYYSLNELVDFYAKKYASRNPMMAIKALTFFDDIDPDLDLPKLKTPLSLDKIKNRLLVAVKNPDKVH